MPYTSKGEIEVIDIAPGIHWVEIAKANLRVLCGTPAEAVKHLMKRGLIKPVTHNGVTFESGPNAILLSDLSLQAGEFCNLAEFPILQILYRQGTLIPNHPNNTGAKPLLIGLPDQLRAQMEYIHRGNYGLTSVEELVRAEVPRPQAEEWMRFKTKFAFGNIRRPEELIDRIALDDHPIDLPGGVVLRRLGVNLFEFSYGEESAVIDLNLPPGEHYVPPYPLNFHDLRREYFAVVHSGDGDGWDINRPSMSSVLMFQGKIYLVDAPPNLHAILRALGIGIQEVEGVFHTHCHDDHFAGLTTLVQADHHIKYFATPAVRSTVTKKLAALMGTQEATFRHFFDIQDLTWDTWNDVDGLEVKPVYSPHPVETSVFKFRTLWQDGYKTYTHLADIAGCNVMKGMLCDGEECPSQQTVETIREAYIEPADLKKIDIGGGLIHGNAEDFRDDVSKKIILAHTSRDLTLKQKEIGSGAPFGTVDTLIAGTQDHAIARAAQFLSTYYTGAPQHHIRLLLNNPVCDLNPETLIIREGEPVDNVILVLSGVLETIEGKREWTGEISAGSVVGEIAALDDGPSDKSVRSKSFAKVLAIPTSLYRTFIASNGLEEQIRKVADLRRFFTRTWLFEDNISAVFKSKIANASTERLVAKGEKIEVNGYDQLILILDGRIERTRKGRAPDIVEVGNFIGAAEVIEASSPPATCVALEDSRVLVIPGEVLRQVPAIRFKLVELYQRRIRQLLKSWENSIQFPWLNEYAIGIPEMDKQHRALFLLGNHLMEDEVLDSFEHTDAALSKLIDTAQRHFVDEEIYLKDIGYPDLDGHVEVHRELMDEIRDIQTRFREDKRLDPHEFQAFFRHWIIDHIFTEDSRYATHYEQSHQYSI